MNDIIFVEIQKNLYRKRYVVQGKLLLLCSDFPHHALYFSDSQIQKQTFKIHAMLGENDFFFYLITKVDFTKHSTNISLILGKIIVGKSWLFYFLKAEYANILHKINV